MRKQLGVLLLGSLLAGIAAAQEISIGKTVLVGANVNVTEPVDGTLHAAGGQVTVNAPVSGSAHLAGGEIVVKSSIADDLRAAGGKIVVDGSVGGDVSAAGGKLELGPNARIGGSVHFRGGELVRDPAAVVTGSVEHKRARTGHSDVGSPFRSFRRGWIWTGGLMLLAALIAGALPGPVRRMTQELVAHPWTAPLLGFIALTCIPIAAVLIMITIIGIPIGLLALMGYAALLLVGYVCASVVVGGLLLDRIKPEVATETAWRVGAAVLAMLSLALLARLPFVGGTVAFFALIFGVGMVVALLGRRWTAETPPSAPSAPATA